MTGAGVGKAREGSCPVDETCSDWLKILRNLRCFGSTSDEYHRPKLSWRGQLEDQDVRELPMGRRAVRGDYVNSV